MEIQRTIDALTAIARAHFEKTLAKCQEDLRTYLLDRDDMYPDSYPVWFNFEAVKHTLTFDTPRPSWMDLEMPRRRSARLAAKRRVDYCEAPIPSEQALKRQDVRGGLAWYAFVKSVSAEIGGNYAVAMRAAAIRMDEALGMDMTEARVHAMVAKGQRIKRHAEAAAAKEQRLKLVQAKRLLREALQLVSTR